MNVLYFSSYPVASNNPWPTISEPAASKEKAKAAPVKKGEIWFKIKTQYSTINHVGEDALLSVCHYYNNIDI